MMVQPSSAIASDLQELSERFRDWRRIRREIADSGAVVGGGGGTGSVTRCVPDGASAAFGIREAQAVNERESDP